MTRFPAPDSRFTTVAVTLTGVGQGRVSTADERLMVDTALPAAQQRRRTYLPKDAAQSLVLTAAPASGWSTQGWIGCDLVSYDRTTCTVRQSSGRDVVAVFSSSAPAPSVELYDLTETTNIVLPDMIEASADATDTDALSMLAGITAGAFIVGPTGDGFLRRVVALEQVDSTRYQFQTADATLAEVVGSGAGALSRALTNGDLAGYGGPTPRASAASAGFSGLDGIQLVPSDDPDDQVFRLQLGTPKAQPMPRAADPSTSVEVTLIETEQGAISASGTIDVSLDVDFASSFCGLACLEHWHFIVEHSASEDLTLHLYLI